MAVSITNFTREALLDQRPGAIDTLKANYAEDAKLASCIALFECKALGDVINLAPWKSRIKERSGDLENVDHRIIGLMERILGGLFMGLIKVFVSEINLEHTCRYLLSFGGHYTSNLLNRDRDARIALIDVVSEVEEEVLNELQSDTSVINQRAPKFAPSHHKFLLNTISEVNPPALLNPEMQHFPVTHIGHYREHYALPNADLMIRLPSNWNFLPNAIQNVLAKEDVQDFELLVQRHDMRWPLNHQNPQQNLNIVPHPWIFQDCRALDNVTRPASIGMFYMNHVSTNEPMANRLQPLYPHLHPMHGQTAFSGNIAKFKMEGDEASFLSVVIYNRRALITYHTLVKRGGDDLEPLNTLEDLPPGWHGPLAL